MVTLTDEQCAINAAGTARCRKVVTAALAARVQPEAEPRPLTRSEAIQQRALERAIAERRNNRIPTRAGATA
jgi:hypothetical protein